MGREFPGHDVFPLCCPQKQSFPSLSLSLALSLSASLSLSRTPSCSHINLSLTTMSLPSKIGLSLSRSIARKRQMISSLSLTPTCQQARLHSSSPLTNNQPLDKIHLRGMVFHGYHGVYEGEKQLGQKFILDCELSLSPHIFQNAAENDNVKQTVNYAAVYSEIKKVVELERFDLIESLGERVSSLILKDFPDVKEVKLCVKKPHVAVEGIVEYLGIETVRKREV